MEGVAAVYEPAEPGLGMGFFPNFESTEPAEWTGAGEEWLTGPRGPGFDPQPERLLLWP